MVGHVPTSVLTGCRILVVEDEYFLADDVHRARAEAGAQILGPINEIADALSFVRATPDIDGAILDINLRGTMVYALADELIRRAVPFVFATGYDQAAIPPAYVEIPRWEKPFDLAALVRSLPALMPRRTLQRTAPAG